MAWVNAQENFDPDVFGMPVVGVASDFGPRASCEHHHALGQLLFTQHGCISIALLGQIGVLPPGRIVWIPPHTPHDVQMKRVVGYRSVYLRASAFAALPPVVAVFETTALLREALERVATAAFDTDWTQGPAANVLAVCLDEISLAPRAPTLLRVPTDRRVTNVSFDTLPPALNALAREAGATEKTITRIFQRETGFSYQQWRQQWRLLKAVELLAKYEALSPVAQALGFASDSAFIAFFRKMTGSAPRAYMNGFETGSAEHARLRDF